MDFLKIRHRRRSLTSTVLYISLNVALPFLALYLVRSTSSMLLPLLLVIISKWRALAVRPRFWWPNLQANMVDVIVGVGVVISMNLVNSAHADDVKKLIFQIFLAIFYVAWLLLIKPRSKRSYVIAQAGIALFMGLSIVFASLSYAVPSFIIVILAWVIGYLAARHVLTSYKEKQITLLSLLWGFYVAELSWLAYHWTIAYSIPGFTFVQIPQVVILASVSGFLSVVYYNSYYKRKKIRLNDVLLPTIFSIAVTIVLLVFFDNITYLQ